SDDRHRNKENSPSEAQPKIRYLHPLVIMHQDGVVSCLQSQQAQPRPSGSLRSHLDDKTDNEHREEPENASQSDDCSKLAASQDQQYAEKAHETKHQRRRQHRHDAPPVQRRPCTRPGHASSPLYACHRYSSSTPAPTMTVWSDPDRSRGRPGFV